MKKIENLSVGMKFRVGLGGVKVSDEIYRGLEKISERFSISDSDDVRDKDVMAAVEWLNDNIHSGDAMDWEYEVDIEE